MELKLTDEEARDFDELSRLLGISREMLVANMVQKRLGRIREPQTVRREVVMDQKAWACFHLIQQANPGMTDNEILCEALRRAAAGLRAHGYRRPGPR